MEIDYSAVPRKKVALSATRTLTAVVGSILAVFAAIALIAFITSSSDSARNAVFGILGLLLFIMIFLFVLLGGHILARRNRKRIDAQVSTMQAFAQKNGWSCTGTKTLESSEDIPKQGWPLSAETCEEYYRIVGENVRGTFELYTLSGLMSESLVEKSLTTFISGPTGRGILPTQFKWETVLRTSYLLAEFSDADIIATTESGKGLVVYRYNATSREELEKIFALI